MSYSNLKNDVYNYSSSDLNKNKETGSNITSPELGGVTGDGDQSGLIFKLNDKFTIDSVNLHIELILIFDWLLCFYE